MSEEEATAAGLSKRDIKNEGNVQAVLGNKTLDPTQGSEKNSNSSQNISGTHQHEASQIASTLTNSSIERRQDSHRKIRKGIPLSGIVKLKHVYNITLQSVAKQLNTALQLHFRESPVHKDGQNNLASTNNKLQMQSVDVHSSSISNFYANSSLDLAFDLVRKSLDEQVERASTLDTKTNITQGSATALISVALVLQALLVSNKLVCITPIPSLTPILSPPLLRALPLLLLLVTYLVVMITGRYAYRTRSYGQVPNPRELFDNYLDKPMRYTKWKVLEAMVEAYGQNERVLKTKVRWINRHIIALTIEATMLVLLLLFQVTC